jgi:DNA-binding GntR family transcriptional regulator
MVDEVYSSLLLAIVEARLGAGTPLSQNKLAARMGVSRTPVREALLRLERDGLVQRLPESGFAVATITADEVHEACDLLHVLDTYVYTRAAGALAGTSSRICWRWRRVWWAAPSPATRTPGGPPTSAITPWS